MNYPYAYGRLMAFTKLGMDSEQAELVDALQQAILDEAEGKSEYLELAEEAEESARPDLAETAKAHAQDEARHFEENKNSLQSMY